MGKIISEQKVILVTEDFSVRTWKSFWELYLHGLFLHKIIFWAFSEESFSNLDPEEVCETTYMGESWNLEPHKSHPDTDLMGVLGM